MRTQHFEDLYQLKQDGVIQISVNELAMLQLGYVALVRSATVSDLGDHFIVITGGLVMKTHGLRPQTLTISAPNAGKLLDQYQPRDGVIVLVLNHNMKRLFHNFYGISVIGNNVIYPTELVVDEVLNVFEKFRLDPSPIDRYDAVGRDILFERIKTFVQRNEPIKFSMLGYPFKSRNTRDKVFGTLPDLGELKSLENFAFLNERIKQVYSPGVSYSIISDGYIFSDLWGIPDTDVLAYNEIVKDMGRIAPITFYDAASFYTHLPNMYEVREKIVIDFGITAEVLEKRILSDLNVNALYRGMIFFMFEELAMESFPSKSQHQKQAKIMAREMMFRNEAYSAMVQDHFHDHIRLSMHNSTNDGEKFSIKLIQGKYKYSPWHSCVAVLKDGQFETVHRAEGIERGYEIVNVNNRPYHFQEV